jgi:hypothetical protein
MVRVVSGIGCRQHRPLFWGEYELGSKKRAMGDGISAIGDFGDREQDESAKNKVSEVTVELEREWF